MVPESDQGVNVADREIRDESNVDEYSSNISMVKKLLRV